MRRWIAVGLCLAVGICAGSLLMDSPAASRDGDESTRGAAQKTSAVEETATVAETASASKPSTVVPTGASVGSGAAGFRAYRDPVTGGPGGAPPAGGDTLAAGNQAPVELEEFQSPAEGGGVFVDARSLRQTVYAVRNERGEIVNKCVPANHLADCGHITAAATTANDKKE